jgi:iron complex outermembrane receptor protein
MIFRPNLNRFTPVVFALAGVVWASPMLNAQDPTDPPAKKAGQDQPARKRDLSDLSIEELFQIDVTSASKKSERLLDTPAAVFVIRSDDLRRSGATNVAEALRMVPGVEVGHIDSNKWSISSRGFSDLFANKLLVLMDGRTAYNPTFSGVYWDVQDVFLQDVDRIEVVRGPGATTWGANAVNGIVNVISKSAKDTLGGIVTLGGGSMEREFAGARYGVQAGENTYLRVYAKWFEREGFPGGNDDWQQGRTGFRLDWVPAGPDALTFQGDFYRGRAGTENIAASLQPPFAVDVLSQTTVTGGNLLGRWTRTFGARDVLTVQGYYDRTDRLTPWLNESRNTLDVDVHYRFPIAEMNDVTCGTGYRWTRGDFGRSFTAQISPDIKVDQIANVFLQDEVAIVKDVLSLTAGCKLEYNNYSHLEIEPTARALWKPEPNQVVWVSASRATRMPSPAEGNVRFNQTVIPGGPPTLISVFGNPDFKSEVLKAYELGYRVTPAANLSFDLTAYYNDYDRLRTVEPGAPGLELSPSPAHILVPLTMANLLDGRAYGVELASQWEVLEGVRMHLSYTYLKTHLDYDSSSQAPGSSSPVLQSDPVHQIYGRLSWDIRKDLHFDAVGRYVDVISATHIASYLESDVRIAWDANPNVEFALVGQNLVERKHFEAKTTGLNIQSTPVERGIYAELTVRF